MPAKAHRRVAFYFRVSIHDQTTENQRRELQAVADKAGWNVVATFEDAGISGAKGRQQRPGYDALLKAITRREVDMVAAWSVDRLGRSMPDLVAFLSDLHARGADLYLHQQAMDTTTPSGRAMFQMMGVFAEFERAMIQERVKAGLARAKAEGRKLGRPTIGTDMEARVRALRAQGMGIVKVAKTLG
ncbi:MAG: resolvase, partial [Xanthobacter sp. 17-67-6]